MKGSALILTMAVGLIAGCDPDPDLDGLDRPTERELGTSNKLADSDGDGYPDGFEVEMGSDPVDDQSLGYKGGWPYNDNADTLEEGAKSGKTFKIGKTWPRMTMVDQFGDQVDLYHFANQGVPVVVDISAEWCPPCRDMAAYIEGEYPPEDCPYANGIDDITTDEQWNELSGTEQTACRFKTLAPGLPEKIEKGEVYWVTILGEDFNYAPPTKKTAKSWYNDFPSPHVPVLADKPQDSVDYAELTGWPTLFGLDEDMKIKVTGQAETFDFALGR